MNNFYIKILSVLFCCGLVACGNSDSTDKNGGTVTEQEKNRINWDAIPSQYNPKIIEENFQTVNSDRIYVDMFSFKDDVEVVYTDSLAQGQGYLKIYTVFKDSGSTGSFNSSKNGSTLMLNRYGQYQCSIKTENNSISNLKGLCFIRLQIFLPAASEIEVYNVKQLITKRFIPIDSETFLKNFKDASFKEGKMATINDFVSSYSGMSKSPQLTSSQLGIVIDDFSWKEEQFEALRKLHIYVTDRQNLGAMIDKEINTFDREEAKRICGL